MAPTTRSVICSPSGMNYSACTEEELKGFIAARTGKKVTTLMTKVQLAKGLRDLDGDPGIFNFLNLPTELRNNVYEQLLLLRSGKGRKPHCFPEILQTCKQIQSEASSILYGDNECQINIVTCMDCHRNDYYKSEIFSCYRFEPRYGARTLSGTRETWPAHTLKFTTLNVNIIVESMGRVPGRNVDALVPVNHALLSFGQIKVLRVKSLLGNETGFDWSSTLWPLVRLSPTIRLELIDFSSNVEAAIKRPVPADTKLIASTIERMQYSLLSRSPDGLQKFLEDVANYFPADLLADLRAARQKARKLDEAMSSLGVYGRYLSPADQRNMSHHAIGLSIELRGIAAQVAEIREIELKAKLVSFQETLGDGTMDRLNNAMSARIAAMEEERKVLMEF